MGFAFCPIPFLPAFLPDRNIEITPSWFVARLTLAASFGLFVALRHRKPGMKAGGIAGLLSTAGVAAATHFLPRYVSTTLMVKMHSTYNIHDNRPHFCEDEEALASSIDDTTSHAREGAALSFFFLHEPWYC